MRLKHQAAEFSGTRGRFAGWEALLRQAGGERPDAPQGPGHGLGGHGLGGLGTDAAGAGPVEADPAGPNVGARGRGFTDEDIERLESFRGRLQKPNPADEGS